MSIPQHLESLLRQRFRLGEGGDWEWFHTSTEPPAVRAGALVSPLDDVARADEVGACLGRHSPTADALPAQGERWFSISNDDGSLAAIAALGRTPVGAPHLSSVAVDASLRGRGLGRTIVAEVTRHAVLDAGVCTLGMYSHNEIARQLYLSLGYELVCAWSSRPVTVHVETVADQATG